MMRQSVSDPKLIIKGDAFSIDMIFVEKYTVFGGRQYNFKLKSTYF